MVPFLNGVAATCALVTGVLFLRFWRETLDRLFMWFALAFWTFAANWTLIALASAPDESRHYIFLLRLAGFVLILVSVIDKNRHRDV
jgi:hypothetical protein